ncbi:MAG TPA: hypothetical protein P5186_13675 [Candidatus Paceibacterota bacterium]|nr:hypothetical protein [Candidatus Paceibacterota bacterium]
MENVNEIATKETTALCYDLGSFEGFNFRTQSAIEQDLSAEDVVNWDHDQEGEAEFWPAGDNDGIAVVFSGKSSITCSELIALDNLLQELGDDSTVNFLRIHYVLNVYGTDLATLTSEEVEDACIDVFIGTNFCDLRREAAYQLFELYYPEEYRIWEKSHCDGLIFDTDRFLDSPMWSVEEITMGDTKALIVASQ